MIIKTILAGCLAVGMIGCAPISKTAEEDMAQPVNCNTAEGDIRSLNTEKAHVGEEIGRGVTAIVPIGLVVGVVTRTEGDSLKVATGTYNKQIDAKIAEIKVQCGIE